MFYIGIDLGTTACKCCLYSENKEIALYNKEYPLITFKDRVEQDANVWWDIVKEGIKDVTKKSGISDIAAISISTQGISIVPVDKNGNTLSNAISWLDNRAIDQTEKIEKQFGTDYIFKLTGKKLLSAYTMPKIMWILENETFADKIFKFLLPLDYLNFKLTGKYITDFTIAGGTMLFDINNRKWDEKLLKFAKINKEMLPIPKIMGEFVGTILTDVADELGISKQTEIILGGQDQKLAALAAGIDKNTATVSLGTATAISVLDIKAGKDFSVFALNEKEKIYEAALTTTGIAVKWLKNILSVSNYSELDELAMQAGGSFGVKFDFDLTKNAKIENLTLNTNKGNIVYALFEAICNEINQYIQPYDIKELKVFGGGAKSTIWCKILSDITKCKVSILETNETACLGAAILASKGSINVAKTIIAENVL